MNKASPVTKGHLVTPAVMAVALSSGRLKKALNKRGRRSLTKDEVLKLSQAWNQRHSGDAVYTLWLNDSGEYTRVSGYLSAKKKSLTPAMKKKAKMNPELLECMKEFLKSWALDNINIEEVSGSSESDDSDVAMEETVA